MSSDIYTPSEYPPDNRCRIRLPWTKPILTMNQSTTSKGALYARNAKVQNLRQAISVLAHIHDLPKGCTYARVQLCYLPPDNRRRDTDNLVATLKPLCDGLVDYGLVSDDTPQFMGKPEPIIWRRRKGDQVGLFLEIECWCALPGDVVDFAPDWALSSR